MDVCESDQAQHKHSAVETPRPPLLPAGRNNGGTTTTTTTRRSRTREVSSRYLSPTPNPSAGPNRRCPSPTITRTGVVAAPKRAISAERRRPSTPPSPSPPTPSTPVHSTNTETQLASRKIAGTRLPEALWPSTMRSLSVSFQSDTFSLPVSKREKPVPHAVSDRTLKPFSNVAHKQAEMAPLSRKPTPERKRSPLKGKNLADQSENSKPVDSLHARLVDQHRWLSRTGGKVSSNSLNKSMDLSNKATKASTMVVPSLRRMSMPDGMTRPLQKSVSDAVKLASYDGSGRVELESYSIDDNTPLRIPKIVSSTSSERTTLVTPSVRFHSLPSPGSRPASPNKPSVSRGPSPSRTRSLNVAPSRGVSPSRIRPSSPSRQSGSSTSVLSFIADIKKGKKGSNHLEDVHQLRLLYNRHLQWRYANAQAAAAQNSQKLTAEITLYNVWRTTSELWESVTEKRFNLQQLRLRLKLYSVLNEQMPYLNDWALIERDHACAVSGAIKDLQASTLRLPVTGGARADIETLRAAVCSAVDVMQTIGASMGSVLSKMEGMNCLVSELADVAAQERAMLDECEALLAATGAMQVDEYSLRTHLMQLKQDWKSGEQPVFGN